MALHEWHVWDDSIGQPLEVLDLLTAAYLERKRTENRLLMAEAMRAVGEVMGNNNSDTQERVPAAQLLHELGIEL